MARLNSGIYGAISGKLGPVIGSTWKGQPYLKSLPRKRSKKRGVKENQNQNKFSQAHYWLQPLLDYVRIGFHGYSPTVEGFNAAKSFCLKHAFTGEAAGQKIDPSRVQLSYGDLPLPSNIKMKRSGDYFLDFSWDKKHNSGNSYDQAMLVAYDCETGQKEMQLTGQFRLSGAHRLELPQLKKQNYHIYIAFIAHDRSRQSNSLYLG
ncbi:MAG TPA: DUF6266 family protein, partial [Chitinophagaceae bacterium]|nr:DUF6266 family protein [Chitinophagaceae bacterium]